MSVHCCNEPLYLSVFARVWLTPGRLGTERGWRLPNSLGSPPAPLTSRFPRGQLVTAGPILSLSIPCVVEVPRPTREGPAGGAGWASWKADTYLGQSYLPGSGAGSVKGPWKSTALQDGAGQSL